MEDRLLVRALFSGAICWGQLPVILNFNLYRSDTARILATMGKKHNSGDTPGRKGRTDRPSSASGSGFYQKFNAPRPSTDRGGRDESPRFGGGSGREGSSAPRSGFGRSTGDRPTSFGGPKKFGASSGGFNKPAGSSFNRGGDSGFGGGYRNRDNDSNSRPYGNRQGEGNRSFDRAAPRRDDDRRSGGFTSRGNDERPARPFEPKKTWQGQPYRQEGKPAVPRGGAGERNRKFVKADPNFKETPAPQPYSAPMPSADENLGPDRAIRPARPFDFRGRPEGFNEEASPRPAQREENQTERPRSNYGERRDASFGSSAGERSGFGSRNFGERREGNFGGNRTGGASQERSFGSRPAPRPYGEREERPARPYGDRPERTERTLRPDTRKGRDASTPNRADKLKRGEVAGQAPDYKNLKHYEADKTRGNKRRREEEEEAGGEVRLNRYIANAGICSRRDADALIAAGEIKVNGQVVTEMGYKVQPNDTVQYGKTNLNREKLVYVLLNKPKDFITTTDDPEGRRTVMELIKEASKERVFPVGRLDRNTTGLLLFTNDGEVAQKLSHPSHRNKKIYQVELDKPLTEEHLKQIAAGLDLEDGKAEVDDVAVVAGNAHFVGIEIHIGRNRIVRRIFEHLGYDVVSLDRVQYAGLTKKDLPRGKWRFLNEKEVIRLKYFM